MSSPNSSNSVPEEVKSQVNEANEKINDLDPQKVQEYLEFVEEIEICICNFEENVASLGNKLLDPGEEVTWDFSDEADEDSADEDFDLASILGLNSRDEEDSPDEEESADKEDSPDKEADEEARKERNKRLVTTILFLRESSFLKKMHKVRRQMREIRDLCLQIVPDQPDLRNQHFNQTQDAIRDAKAYVASIQLELGELPEETNTDEEAVIGEESVTDEEAKA
ncbi:hypothetical protein F4818DRAFT_423967 [Hypoxylon cercidicola]|nr:hypothetical protein F4818DRAFT_423967 [Hypoxylon cercidicola]